MNKANSILVNAFIGCCGNYLLLYLWQHPNNPTQRKKQIYNNSYPGVILCNYPVQLSQQLISQPAKKGGDRFNSNQCFICFTSKSSKAFPPRNPNTVCSPSVITQFNYPLGFAAGVVVFLPAQSVGVGNGNKIHFTPT